MSLLLTHKEAIAHGSLSYYSKPFNIIGEITNTLNDTITFTVTRPPDEVVEVVEVETSYDNAEVSFESLKNKYLGQL